MYFFSCGPTKFLTLIDKFDIFDNFYKFKFKKLAQILT